MTPLYEQFSTMGIGMHRSPDQNARDEVIQAYRLHLQAMANGDTDALDRMLDDSFTLTHITGYVQPKNEWLSQMRAGQFVYHEIEDESVTVQIQDDTARIAGEIVMDATIGGSRSQGRLRLTMDYARQGDAWIAIRSVGTIW